MIGLAFSVEQFRTLLRAIYIANTVVNARRDEDFLTEYDDLEQYIFSRAKDAGLPLATWTHRPDGGEAHHHPSATFEDDPEVNMLMDAYEEHVMRETLAEKLARRDIEKKHGPRESDGMTAEDHAALLNERADMYEKIFSESGVVRIVVEGVK